MRKYQIGFLLALLAVSASASAQVTPDSVVNMVSLAMKPAMSTLTTTAIAWLGALATLQLIITNIGVLKSGGDLEAVWAKLLGSIFWIGMCVYILLNGPEFIAKVGDSFFKIIGTSLPSATDMILDALVLVGKMVVASMVGAAIPAVGNTLGPLIVYIMIFNFAVSLFFAFKIFMIQLELGLVVMLSPLSFSLLGLDALKDQGIAPFKALISLAYRIILMTVIMGAYAQVSAVVGDEFAKFGDLSASDLVGSGISNLMKTVISAFGAYLVLAYLLWKSDSIAASLASGSTNMGTADIASAAAVGAAAGAAVATGGTALAATKMPLPIPNLGGGGLSVSNGGGSGSGGGGGGRDAMPATASLGDAPKPPPKEVSPHPVDSKGQPLPPKPDGGASSAKPAASGASTPPSASAPPASPTPAGAPTPQAGSAAPTGSKGQPIAPAPASHAEGSAIAGHASTNSAPSTPVQETGWGKARQAASELGKHLQNEKAATHISINTHNNT